MLADRFSSVLEAFKTKYPALIGVDVSSTAIKLVDAAVSRFGRLDLLVNNAGIYMAKPFTEYTPEDFELMIGTNIVSNVIGARFWTS